METVACVAGGIILVASSIGLSFIRAPQWLSKDDPAPLHGKAIARWSTIQRVVRWCTNILLGICGGLIIATGFVPHGKIWMLLWAIILLTLLVTLFCAAIDALSSMVGYQRAIPEAARRSFSRNE